MTPHETKIFNLAEKIHALVVEAEQDAHHGISSDMPILDTEHICKMIDEVFPEEVKCDGTMCLHNKEDCDSFTDELGCTLPKGHSGNHIACGGKYHNLKIWS